MPHRRRRRRPTIWTITLWNNRTGDGGATWTLTRDRMQIADRRRGVPDGGSSATLPGRRSSRRRLSNDLRVFTQINRPINGGANTMRYLTVDSASDWQTDGQLLCATTIPTTGVISILTKNSISILNSISSNNFYFNSYFNSNLLGPSCCNTSYKTSEYMLVRKCHCHYSLAHISIQLHEFTHL